MQYRYLSPYRPLGSWVSLDIPYSLEIPTETDINPFDPTWKIHDVLITESPLNKEKVKALQLWELSELNNAKSLYDTLQSMKLDVKAPYYETCIKEELSQKITEFKIKNIETLNKMVDKYVKYVNN